MDVLRGERIGRVSSEWFSISAWLPAPLAGSNLQHGLLMHCAELVEADWRHWVRFPGRSAIGR